MIAEMVISSLNQDPEFAYQIGYFLGILFMIAILVAIPVLFVISLVKAVKYRKKVWIVFTIITGSILIIPLVLFFYGIYLGIGELADSGSTEVSDGESQILISKDSLCQITIPNHWRVMDDLNEEASLQAGNVFREEYLIILTDYKSDFVGSIEDHASVTTQSLLELLDEGNKGDFEAMKINGLSALQCEIVGISELTRIVYLHTTIEGELCYYQLLAWTLPSKMPAAMKTFKEVIPSFKELQGKSDDVKNIARASLSGVILR